MGDDRSDTGLEGWSIVRHRDDVGSDADSVEVISDDSDRDTCDEGKDTCDDEQKTEAADSTTVEPTTSDSGGEEEVGTSEEEVGTREEGVGTTDEGDLDSDLLRLDPLGDLTQRLSNKLHEFLLVPRHIHNDCTRQDLKLRYVIIASTLLALICSLLVSSYLLFHKFQELSEKRDDSSSAEVLQQLEQAISRLQSVLRLENKQYLQDSLSKMPPDYLSLDKIVSNDGFYKRKPLKRSHAVSTMENEDFGVIMSIEETREITSERHEDNAKKTFYLKDEKLPGSLDCGAEKSPCQKGNQKNNAIDQANSLDKNMNMPLHKDLPSNTKTDDPNNLTKAEILNTDTPVPAQVESKTYENLYDIKSDNHVTSSKDSEMLDSDAKDILLSVRQDVLSVQNQLYSKIMNSLFEYKIDLYKNLLRAGLDSTCNVGHSNKNSNHKKFMLIRNLHNMISRSSESNFESWYKFYSHSVSPRFRRIINKLNSITIKRGRETKSTAENGVMDKVKPQQSATSDDFFIRSSVPHGGSDYETIHPPASDGFDWKNLNNKIRECMNKARLVSKEQPVANNQEKTTAAGENTSSHNKASSGNKYNNGEMPNFVEASKIQDGGKIYNGEKAFEEFPTVRPERSSEKEESKKTRDESEVRNNKDEKPANKHDPANDGRSEFSKQDKEKNFERDSGVGNSNFEKNKKSDDELWKEKVKYEQRNKKGGGTKEHFRKEHCSGGRCDKGDGRDYYFHDGRQRRKSFLNNMTKYVKKAASGLWKTVRGGFKKVKNYGSYIKNWHTGEEKGKGNYEEWRKEFVKEMKDVIRVLGGNPAINGLYELPKSVTRFFGDGLGNLMNTEREWDEEVDVEGVRKGPAGVKLDECNPNERGDKMGSYEMCSDDSEDVKVDDSGSGTEDEEVDKASWYAEAAKHRAESRGESYPGSRSRPAGPSWFLGLGRHRSYLRRRGIHLDDDGSWFISSARHRAKMRQRHTDSPQLPQHFVQASSKSTSTARPTHAQLPDGKPTAVPASEPQQLPRLTVVPASTGGSLRFNQIQPQFKARFGVVNQ